MESLTNQKIADFLLSKYKDILAEHPAQTSISIEEIVDEIVTYYEAIISCMPGNVYWLDKNGTAIGCNKNVLDMFNLKSMEDFKGLTFNDMQRIGNWTEEATKSFEMDTLEVIRSNKPKLNIPEPPIPHANGQTIYFLTSRVPLVDHNNNVIGVVGISVDITELRNAQESLKKAKEEAEQANKLKSDFISNMEHDIRTPFNGIYSMTKILEKQETDNTKKEYLSAIANCAKQLLDYCNGILDFSTIENRHLLITAQKFNLKQLVNDIIVMEIPAAKVKNLQLIQQYSDDIPSIFISDPYRMKRILINLIGNAIKFTEKGYVKVCINLAKVIDEQHVILNIIIEDTGIGIPKDKQKLIYGKFHRLSAANQGFYSGLGLGLTIVKQFIEELEGEIEIESKPNYGTTFVCSLPMRLPIIQNLVASSEHF